MKLVVNPHLQIVSPTQPSGAKRVELPVRGRGRFFHNLQDPSIMRCLKIALPLLEGRESSLLNISEADQQMMRETGFLVSRDEISKKVSFRCELDFKDKSPVQTAALRAAGLVVAQSVVYSENGEIPSIFSTRISVPPEMDISGPTVWVMDPKTQLISPFSLPEDRRLLNPLRKVLMRKSEIKNLPISAISTLYKAGILAPRTGSRTLARESVGLKSQGYAKVKNLLNPIQLSAMQKYYAKIIAEGWVEPSCGQVSLRMMLHNEPVARFFHHQMGPYISSLTGARWKPSYTYWVSYREGAILKKHTDRKQCALSLSLLVAHWPDGRLSRKWPLILSPKPGKLKTLRFAVGEGAVYDGRKIPHYRTALPAGQSTVNIFFHFVRSGFKGTLD